MNIADTVIYVNHCVTVIFVNNLLTVTFTSLQCKFIFRCTRVGSVVSGIYLQFVVE